MSTQTLQITKANARKLFPTASGEFKQMLIDTFGEEFFSQKITDRIKTFNDACEALSIDPTKQIPAQVPGSDGEAIKAYAMMFIIARALNEGWKPDWNNSSQYKYYPWFDMRAGSGFSGTFYVFSVTDACVGSRLCFKSRELAEYAGTQFVELYKLMFTL